MPPPWWAITRRPRMPVHLTGVDEPGEGGRRLVRPAERPPDPEVGLALGRVVGPCGVAGRVQPDHPVERLDPREDRVEAGIVQWHAADVGEELDAERAQLADRMVNLAQRRLDVTQRQGRREAREPVGEAPHQAGHLLVGAARHLGGGLRRVHLLERRDGEYEDLRVVAVPVHHPEAGVEVADDRVEAGRRPPGSSAAGPASSSRRGGAPGAADSRAAGCGRRRRFSASAHSGHRAAPGWV